MSTLWEMAETIRAEEARARGEAAPAPQPSAKETARGEKRKSAFVDLRGHIDYWCKMLGTTRLQLCRAVAEVGDDPGTVRKFLADLAR
ncbi:MAG TPA: DUF3606 domain-containing protein [Rudaea sp.]|nr:DUF3606 domain-containing protein [Rudaea sp.]